MIGWRFGVHRFADPELRASRGDPDSTLALIAGRAGVGEVPPATDEDPRVASWEAGLGGIYWLDELVDAGKAAHTTRGGLPESYLVRCRDFRARLRAGLPNEVIAARNGDLRGVEDCDDEEWLLVEAWHEAERRRAVAGGER